MSLISLPRAAELSRPKGFVWDPPSDILARWAEMPMAAQADDPATISVFDEIGEDPWTGEGWTAKRMAGTLRSIGKKPVTVALNSPGGDMFEGLAIYNLLAEHPEKVTVKVMGMAASAASFIAMAADEIVMGAGSFMMIHNAWGVVIGNRNDMRAAADIFDKFDGAMTDIYAARTGRSKAKVSDLMDAETYMTAKEAVQLGFADSMADFPAGGKASASLRPDIAAKRRMDATLAQAGIPRSERRAMMRDLSGPHDSGTHDAAGSATPRAGDDLTALRSLLEILKS